MTPASRDTALLAARKGLRASILLSTCSSRGASKTCFPGHRSPTGNSIVRVWSPCSFLPPRLTCFRISEHLTVQTAPGQVQLAVMHTAEMDASTEDLRVTAMHLRSPIHTLMFNSKGDLLGANTSALDACHIHTPGTCQLALAHYAQAS